MPLHWVKVTQKDGSRRSPIIANFPTKEKAVQAVRSRVGDDDAVELSDPIVREDVIRREFGDIPEGEIIFCDQYTWDPEKE